MARSKGGFAGQIILSTDGKIEGALARQNVGVGPGCLSLGYANIDGQVITAKGEFVGCLAANGEILDNQKVVLGRILDSAIALNADGRVVGIMDPTGKIQDKQGKILGCMDPDGLVINSKMNRSVC